MRWHCHFRVGFWVSVSVCIIRMRLKASVVGRMRGLLIEDLAASASAVNFTDEAPLRLA